MAGAERHIVHRTAGESTADLFARLYANHFQQAFGTAFVVEKFAPAPAAIFGGGGREGKITTTATSLPLNRQRTTPSISISTASCRLTRRSDFQPVSLTRAAAERFNAGGESGKIPAKNVNELIRFKACPDKLSYGSSGVGTSIHLSPPNCSRIKTGTQMTRIYRSSNEIMQNLTGGHIDLAFDNITLAWPQAKSGTLRALAVTSVDRSRARRRFRPLRKPVGLAIRN